MARLKPLEEWICDTCSQLVTVSNGWLEWRDPDNLPRDFRIVHNVGRCQRHKDTDCCDSHLDQFVGAPGLQTFLAMLDRGPLLDPDALDVGKVGDMRSLVEAIRRLHIPYYEEARQYFGDALADGWFLDNNEVSIFRPDTCKRMIERYGALEDAKPL